MKPGLIVFSLLTTFSSIISCRKTDVGNPMAGSSSPPPGEKKWIVSTVAGNGNASFANGVALLSAFHFPEDLVVANDGSIYVTDGINSLIRKISNDLVYILAGSGEFGISEGSGISSKFKYPLSITLDANGNLYTTDEDDPRIRKISSSGEVSNYAGAETPGFADGSLNTSMFRPGNYLAADEIGNLYVSDAQNNRIRTISVSGQVKTIAGTGVEGFKDGTGTMAQFNFPAGIVLDKQGNLYVADRSNFRIRKISTTGNVSTIAGSGLPGDKDGNASVAQFSLDMRDLIIDSLGNLYLAEGNRIRKISPEGIVSTIAGSVSGFVDGDGHSAKFNYPNGLSIDTQGKIYVADLRNNRIRKISFE